MQLFPPALAIALALVACGDAPSGVAPDASDEGADASAATDASSGPLTCSGLSVQPEDSEWTIRSGDLDRIAAVHVPASYDPTQPAAVVLNFHGYASSGPQQATISRMNDKADAEGFIAVHATGVGAINSWNGGACCGSASQNDVDDVAFTRDLLDELALRLCIDPARSYATGFSNGGFLSHRLACELSDRIAAIAPVAGVLGIETCTPPRPVPVMHFHGTADTIVPYAGSIALGFPSVEDTIDGWHQRNSCTGESPGFENGQVSCTDASGCEDGGPVTLCTITAGGHTWPGGVPIPGGGITTTDISATDAMWDFFVANPHPTL